MEEKSELKEGTWYNDLTKMPTGETLLLYCGEIGIPCVGAITDDGEEVVSADREYDGMEVKHLESFMIIPDC